MHAGHEKWKGKSIPNTQLTVRTETAIAPDCLCCLRCAFAFSSLLAASLRFDGVHLLVDSLLYPVWEGCPQVFRRSYRQGFVKQLVTSLRKRGLEGVAVLQY